MIDPLRDRQQDPPGAYCDECGDDLYNEWWASPYISGHYCKDCFGIVAARELRFHEEPIPED
jgi:hypothetical protein